MESAFQIINGDVVLGGKGDTFENVTSSAIINRSAVQHALNNLGSDEDADLRGALAELCQGGGIAQRLGRFRPDGVAYPGMRRPAAEIERAGSAVRALPAGSGRAGS